MKHCHDEDMNPDYIVKSSEVSQVVSYFRLRNTKFKQRMSTFPNEDIARQEMKNYDDDLETLTKELAKKVAAVRFAAEQKHCDQAFRAATNLIRNPDDHQTVFYSEEMKTNGSYKQILRNDPTYLQLVTECDVDV